MTPIKKQGLEPWIANGILLCLGFSHVEMKEISNCGFDLIIFNIN
jgi:hypothetical protein